MLINYTETLETIRQIRSGVYKEGERLDIPEIDEYIRFKPNNLNVILGHANVGKTSMILFLMLCYTIKHKKRWLVYSSENEPHSILRKLIEYLCEKPINKLSDKELDDAQKFINDYFKIISNEHMMTYKDLLELAGAVKNAWSYDGFLIDPYNSIAKDQQLLKNLGGHEYDYHCTTEMRVFCKKTKTSIWLNVHANTEAQRKRHRMGHTYEDMPIPPFSADAEGGSKFVNRCDDFFVIHRYTQHPADYIYTHFIVRKVKEIETGGRPTPYEEPILFKSLVNNVGYAINNDSIVKSLKYNNLPFKFYNLGRKETVPLELIFNKHKDWCNIVQSFGCNKETAEDLVQEMYIKVDQHLKNGKDFMYEDEVNYYFIYLILLNLFRDLKRKEKDVHLIGLELLPELADLDSYEQDDELMFEKCRAIEHWLNDERYIGLLQDGATIDDYSAEKMNAFYLRNIFDEVFVKGKKLTQFSKDTNITYWSLRNTIKNIKKQINKLYESGELSSSDN